MAPTSALKLTSSDVVKSGSVMAAWSAARDGAERSGEERPPPSRQDVLPPDVDERCDYIYVSVGLIHQAGSSLPRAPDLIGESAAHTSSCEDASFFIKIKSAPPILSPGVDGGRCHLEKSIDHSYKRNVEKESIHA